MTRSITFYAALSMRYLIGLVFVISAIGKLVNPYLTIQFLMVLFPAFSVTVIKGFVYFFIGFEFLLAVFLFIGWKKRLFLWISLVLMIAFCLVIGWQLIYNPTVGDCGCFGAFDPHTTLITSLWRDIGLCAVIVVILYLDKRMLSSKTV
ncbi:MAG TPA: MauE/DoxX family redox-associated membrane protein [Balneolales bacterium]|nr:MauE/DoxX family redox-associated membrane protein [Balneolales bacterium]